MRKPKEFKNKEFWLSVAKDPKQVKEFQERGDERQKKCLELALKHLKWLKIQERKENDS